MKRILCISLLGLSLVASMSAASKQASDIVQPARRHDVVTLAERNSRPNSAEQLPAELVSPFSPPGFETPEAAAPSDRSEVKAAGESKNSAPMPATDRDVLAAVAGKIPTTGTIILGGKPLLISGKNRIEVGSHFTVVYNGQEYELELVAIDRTTFTVRYKGEEFTRPIKQAKSP